MPYCRAQGVRSWRSPSALFFCAMAWRGELHRFGAGNAPPIFFACGKENGPCTVQKKPLFCRKFGIRRMPLCLLRELLVRSSDRGRQSSAGCAMLCSLNNCFPTGRAAVENRGGQSLVPASLSALSAARAEFAAVSYPRGWNPKEGAAAPSFESLGGVGASRNAPTFLFGGRGGRFSF